VSVNTVARVEAAVHHSDSLMEGVGRNNDFKHECSCNNLRLCERQLKPKLH